MSSTKKKSVKKSDRGKDSVPYVFSPFILEKYEKRLFPKGVVDFSVDSVLEFIQPEPNSGCWLWRGPTNVCGYGIFWRYDHPFLVHKLMYQFNGGALNRGEQIDHLCKVRICCNPKHLEAVKHLENLARSSRFLGRRDLSSSGFRLTHCPHGHEYTEDNIIRYKCKRGFSHIKCRLCGVERQRKIRQKTKIMREPNEP